MISMFKTIIAAFYYAEYYRSILHYSNPVSTTNLKTHEKYYVVQHNEINHIICNRRRNSCIFECSTINNINFTLSKNYIDSQILMSSYDIENDKKHKFKTTAYSVFTSYIDAYNYLTNLKITADYLNKRRKLNSDLNTFNIYVKLKVFFMKFVHLEFKIKKALGIVKKETI